MPANEFEKQVQQRLDEFQLNPSASVWEKVEEELRNKKKRRIIFFLLPALVLLLGFSAYYFLDNGRKATLTNDGIGATTNALTPADKINPSTRTKNETAASPLKEKAQSFETGKEDQVNPKNTIIENNKLDISFPVTPTRRVNIKQPANRMQMIETEAMSPVKDKNAPANDKNTVGNTIPVIVAKPSTGVITKSETKEPAIMDDKSDKQKESSRTASKDTAMTKADSLAAVVKTSSGKKAKKTSKVKWGVDFFAGASSVQSEIFSLKGSSYDAMYLNNATSGASPGAQVVPPSDVNAGFSFRIGVAVEWKISGKSSFSTGLQYAYASNRIKVGSATDTTVRNPANFASFQSYTIYRGAQTEDHTNSYHFISVPLEYHHLVSKKIPLQWDLGVAFNYLLATNALIYSSSYGGIYYEDKQAFYKMHFTIGTGLSFRLKSKNGMEWVTGPVISFDTGRLLKDNNNKQYLVFTGLNTKLYFR